MQPEVLQPSLLLDEISFLIYYIQAQHKAASVHTPFQKHFYIKDNVSFFIQIDGSIENSLA